MVSSIFFAFSNISFLLLSSCLTGSSNKSKGGNLKLVKLYLLFDVISSVPSLLILKLLLEWVFFV